jgi:hypothetical protein
MWTLPSFAGPLVLDCEGQGRTGHYVVEADIVTIAWIENVLWAWDGSDVNVSDGGTGAALADTTYQEQETSAARNRFWIESAPQAGESVYLYLPKNMGAQEKFQGLLEVKKLRKSVERIVLKCTLGEA